MYDHHLCPRADLPTDEENKGESIHFKWRPSKHSISVVVMSTLTDLSKIGVNI